MTEGERDINYSSHTPPYNHHDHIIRERGKKNRRWEEIEQSNHTGRQSEQQILNTSTHNSKQEEEEEEGEERTRELK